MKDLTINRVDWSATLKPTTRYTNAERENVFQVYMKKLGFCVKFIGEYPEEKR